MIETPSRLIRKRKRKEIPTSAPCHSYNTRSSKRRLNAQVLDLDLCRAKDLKDPPTPSSNAVRVYPGSAAPAPRSTTIFSSPGNVFNSSSVQRNLHFPAVSVTSSIAIQRSEKLAQILEDHETSRRSPGPLPSSTLCSPLFHMQDLLVPQKTRLTKQEDRLMLQDKPHRKWKHVVLWALVLILPVGWILSKMDFHSKVTTAKEDLPVAHPHPFCFLHDKGNWTRSLKTEEAQHCRAFPRGLRYVRNQQLVHRVVDSVPLSTNDNQSWILLPHDVADEVEAVYEIYEKLMKVHHQDHHQDPPKAQSSVLAQSVMFFLWSIVFAIALFYATGLLAFSAMAIMLLISNVWKKHYPHWTIKWTNYS